MEVRILGELEVVAGEHHLEITAPKQRMLLTVLALCPGQVVSADRLMDELWGDEPPSAGLKTLHYHVSKLRDTLEPITRPNGDSVITTRSSGYVLDIPPDSVDAVRFEREVTAARRLLEYDPTQAGTKLGDALGLWRGSMPSELLDAPAAGLEARRLEELRLTALEDRLNADLATGRHAEIVPELEALVQAHPLRERLWAQLIVALYRGGRPADALRSYQALRIHLRDELGIEPSPDLRRLEERILLQEPDLDVPDALQRPASLRGYELHEQIGAGAFGLVWRASQVSVDRHVAIKIVRPEHSNRPASVLGFQAQAQLLAALEHPHIVPVFDFWRDPDGAYLVMPLMDGGSLEEQDTANWDTSRLLRVVEQIASGLAHAHRLNLVHADLHPGNILFDNEANAYLADFGLAANLSGGTSTPSEQYASPEQIRGSPASTASDVYGLARVVYRVFTGRSPVPGPLPPVRSDDRQIKPALNTVLHRASNVDPAQRYANAAEFLDDVHRAFGQAAPLLVEPRNPYKGLQAFDETDASDFFGRDDLVTELVSAVENHRLVTVVGPSGSGKSSLVRAGLVPALRSGRVDGSNTWLVTHLYPGIDPLGSLVEALRSVAVRPVPPRSSSSWDPIHIPGTVRRLVPPDEELVVIVDQFEELFTLCPMEEGRRRFMDVLLALACDLTTRARVILTLRADYYGLPLEYPLFGNPMRNGVVSIASLGPDEMTQAIVGPAAGVGVHVDPQLAADIVGELGSEPGGLPLMEYALTQLFEERIGSELGREAYRERGGLAAALTTWPEGLYEDLDPSSQLACTQLFLRLVTVDESGQGSRRRVPLPELYALGFEAAIMDDVLDRFTTARLLTLDRDPQTRTRTVELAHEALLARWDRLREWVEGRRESLILQRRFRVAVDDWERSKRDTDYLLSGGRLRQFEEWSRETDLALTSAEQSYLLASRMQQKRADGSRRRGRRLVGAGLGLLSLLAVVFGVTAVIQRGQATDQRFIAESQADVAVAEAARAEQQAALAQEMQLHAENQTSAAVDARALTEIEERTAHARSLAAASAANYEADPELAVLLAIEAIETTRQADGTALREAEEALHAAVTANRLVSTIAIEMFARTIAFDSEQLQFFVGGATVGDVVDVSPSWTEGNLGVMIGGGELQQANIAVIATAGSEDELLIVAHHSPGSISVLDASTFDELFVLDGHSTWVTDLEVSENGLIVASIDPFEGTLIVWDLVERIPITEFALDCDPDCPRGLALSSDGNVVTSGNTVWEVHSGEVLLADVATGVVADVEMIDDNQMIVAVGQTARIVNLADGEEQSTLRGHGANIRTIDVEYELGWAATGGEDGLVKLWDLTDTGATDLMTLAGHDGTVWDVKFAPGGRYLISAAGRQEFPDADLVADWPRNWEARIWDISAGGGGELMGAATRDADVAFDPTGRFIVVAGADVGAAMWDTETGTRHVDLAGWAIDSQVTAAAFSPDGTSIALGGTAQSEDGDSDMGWVAVFDPASGEMTHDLVAPTVGMAPKDLSFSEDGSLLALASFGLARVWDTASWAPSVTPSDFSDATEFTAVGFHPDGELVFTQSVPFDRSWPVSGELWNIQTGEAVLIPASPNIPRDDHGSVAVSPDGRLVVSAGIGRPRLTETFTARALATLEASPAYAPTAAFSPDGSRIATGEADGTVRLWDAATGEEQLILRGHTAVVVDVTFSADGSRLASVGLDGTTRVWALDLAELLDLAKSSVTRPISDVECRAYVVGDCPPPPGLDRLLPAAGEWDGPFGIQEATWQTAPIGGIWTEERYPYPADLGHVETRIVHPESGRIFYFNDWGSLKSWSLGLESGEWSEVSSMPGPAESGMPIGTVGPLAYHPELDLIITTRADDGATLGYDLTNDSWSELAPTNEAFAGRYGSGLVYDAESGALILFGGAEWGRTDQGKHVGRGDTWVFDAVTLSWIEATPNLSPPPRIWPAMVYDRQSDRIVMFGGATKLNGETYADTWAYDTNAATWTEMQPSVSPPRRAGSAIWYDTNLDATFVFGGTADWSAWPALPWMVLGSEELWSYDLEADDWTLYWVEKHPGYRTNLAAAYDTRNGETILVDGDYYEDRRYQGWRFDVWTYRHEAE